MMLPKPTFSCISPPAARALIALLAAVSVFVPLTGCKEKVKSQERAPAEVSVIKIVPRDTPIVVEFVGQTQGSHQVEIRARVNGFLDRRTYNEGSQVKAGQIMFKMDPKPFQAQLDAAQGALEQQEARLRTARANLARVKPLVAQNALSQKDLDDATGQEQAAAAAVESAGAEVEQAKLNLGYTTIYTPVTGFSSYARVQDGAYVNPQNSLLTYVVQANPIWVNFSLSENDVLKYRGQAEEGQLRVPPNAAYIVQIVLGDGSVFPRQGKITFRDAEYNAQTGTFLVRATLPNPGAVLRPGQFVRVRLLGAMRPNAITVPQRTVQQGAKGHFVWVINNEGKAEPRPVNVGEWIQNDWFISKGLRAGDLVVQEGGITLRPGEPVKVKAQTTQKESIAASAPSGTEATTMSADPAGGRAGR